MRLICVVDDAVQRGSAFWGEHGLAFLIETEGRRVLFDTGQSGTVLLRNLKLMHVELAQIDAMAISHAHHDHTGGLPELLKHLCPGTPLYASPDLFRERFSRRQEKLQRVGLSMARAELAAQMTLGLSATPQEIIPGIWTTGEILERPEAEGSSDNHLMLQGNALVPDAYRDDMALVLQMGDQLMLLCGCCHAGARDARLRTPDRGHRWRPAPDQRNRRRFAADRRGAFGDAGTGARLPQPLHW